jgi:2,4-didehydro-3-deoxy-L-rhamnonate hydrolase
VRLATLADGRTVRIEGDSALPLPGRLIDHLCRPPAHSSDEPVALEEAELSAPLHRPGKVVCLGLNYADHAKEAGQDPPEKPLLFGKVSTTVIGPGAPIVIPRGEANVDYEAELAVVIGRPGRQLAPEDAMDVVGGYTCFNDVSERLGQFADGQWFRSKSHDTFAPLGPWIVTPDEIEDPHALSISCTVNDEVRQDSNTSQMIFSIPEIVSHCSAAFTLEPGDVIATGTPPGVALATGKWLSPGDEVTIAIEGIGSLTNPVVAPS